MTGIQAPNAALAAPTGRQHERRWWILAVLAIAQLMVVLDSTYTRANT